MRFVTIASCLAYTTASSAHVEQLSQLSDSLSSLGQLTEPNVLPTVDPKTKWPESASKTYGGVNGYRFSGTFQYNKQKGTQWGCNYNPPGGSIVLGMTKYGKEPFNFQRLKQIKKELNYYPRVEQMPGAYCQDISAGTDPTFTDTKAINFPNSAPIYSCNMACDRYNNPQMTRWNAKSQCGSVKVKNIGGYPQYENKPACYWKDPPTDSPTPNPTAAPTTPSPTTPSPTVSDDVYSRPQVMPVVRCGGTEDEPLFGAKEKFSQGYKCCDAEKDQWVKKDEEC